MAAKKTHRYRLTLDLDDPGERALSELLDSIQESTRGAANLFQKSALLRYMAMLSTADLSSIPDKRERHLAFFARMAMNDNDGVPAEANLASGFEPSQAPVAGASSNAGRGPVNSVEESTPDVPAPRPDTAEPANTKEQQNPPPAPASEQSQDNSTATVPTDDRATHSDAEQGAKMKLSLPGKEPAKEPASEQASSGAASPLKSALGRVM